MGYDFLMSIEFLFLGDEKILELDLWMYGVSWVAQW